MIKYRKYFEDERTDEVWYESSMIVYTKMVEDEFDNVGELYITFTGGNTYVYHSVSLADYVLFIGGGTDGSHGKTINKIIKPKYECEKVEPLNCNELEERYNSLMTEEKSLANEPITIWNQLKKEISSIKDYMDNIDDSEVTKDKLEELMELLNAKFGTSVEN